MAVPAFVYGLLLLIEAFGPVEVPMSVDVVRNGSVADRLLLEAEQTVYRVRDIETDERRLEIERSRIYGHVFFVFGAGDGANRTDGAAPDTREPDTGEADAAEPRASGPDAAGAAGENILAVDFSPVLAALAAAQPAQDPEPAVETADAGTWTLLVRGDSIIIASADEPLFLHARPAVLILQ